MVEEKSPEQIRAEFKAADDAVAEFAAAFVEALGKGTDALMMAEPKVEEQEIDVV